MKNIFFTHLIAAIFWKLCMVGLIFTYKANEARRSDRFCPHLIGKLMVWQAKYKKQKTNTLQTQNHGLWWSPMLFFFQVKVLFLFKKEKKNYNKIFLKYSRINEKREKGRYCPILSHWYGRAEWFAFFFVSLSPSFPLALTVLRNLQWELFWFFKDSREVLFFEEKCEEGRGKIKLLLFNLFP